MAQLMHDLYVELQLTAPAVSADDEQKELNIHARTSKLYTQGLVNVETLSLHQSLKQVLQDMRIAPNVDKDTLAVCTRLGRMYM